MCQGARGTLFKLHILVSLNCSFCTMVGLRCLALCRYYFSQGHFSALRWLLSQAPPLPTQPHHFPWLRTEAPVEDQDLLCDLRKSLHLSGLRGWFSPEGTQQNLQQIRVLGQEV